MQRLLNRTFISLSDKDVCQREKPLGDGYSFITKNSRSIEKRAHIKYKQAKLYNEQHSAPVERVAGSTKKNILC